MVDFIEDILETGYEIEVDDPIDSDGDVQGPLQFAYMEDSEATIEVQAGEPFIKELGALLNTPTWEYKERVVDDPEADSILLYKDETGSYWLYVDED